MLTNTIHLKASLFVCCFYNFILLNMYCLNERRRLLYTLIILFHLYSACVYLESNFIFMLIIIVMFVPLFLHSNENKINCSMMSIFFPLFIILIFQIYGFKNLVGYFKEFNVKINNLVNFDLFGYAQNLVHGDFIQEFKIISEMFNLIKKISE